MNHDKNFLRKKFILLRKRNFSNKFKFPFQQIFKIIKKKYKNKKISIAGYYPSNFEVNILKFMKSAEEKKYTISLPHIKTDNTLSFKVWKFGNPLYVNNFGIPEPKNSSHDIAPEVFLLPLVSFDEKMNRIGYGKGYYDKSLNEISKKRNDFITIGIAYSFQKYHNIPKDNHDFKLDYVFTEQGIISSVY
jgi:5-formyltetrahydrofolate cyclo-ligase